MPGSLVRNRIIAGSLLLILFLLVSWYLGVSYRMSVLVGSARESLARRDFPVARESLRQALSLRPSDSEALLLAAQTARRTDKLDEARDLLRKASQVHADPDTIEFEQRLLRWQQGDLNDAHDQLKTIRKAPQEPQQYLLLESMIVGSLHIMHLALTQECLAIWVATYQDTQDQIQGWMWQGELAIRRGDYEKALDIYRKVIALNPAHGLARRRLVEILVRYDPKESLRHLKILQEEDPANSSLQLLYARTSRSLGELEKAQDKLDRLLTDSPDDIDVLLERGQVALDGRQYDEAERFFRRAEVLAPNRRDTLQALSRCLQLAGDKEQAQVYQQRLATIDAEIQRRIDAIFGKKKPANSP